MVRKYIVKEVQNADNNNDDDEEDDEESKESIPNLSLELASKRNTDSMRETVR